MQFFHCFDEASSSRLQICPLYISEKLSATDGTKLDLNIGVLTRGLALYLQPRVDPLSKTVSSFKIYRIGLGY